jgi:hypothetical protein
MRAAVVQPVESDLDTLITVKEAAKLCPSPYAKHVNVATVYRWIMTGKLKAVRRNRTFFVTLRDLNAMLVPVVPAPRLTCLDKPDLEAMREGLRRVGMRA